MNNYVSGKTETVETAIEPAKQISEPEMLSKQCLLHGKPLVPDGLMHFLLDISVSPYTFGTKFVGNIIIQDCVEHLLLNIKFWSEEIAITS
jgi:hypothetical protein